MLSVSVSDAAKTGNASNSRTLATYSYDDSVHNGLLQSMTYGNNATVEYEYDIFDRTTKETYNNGVVYNYAYDASGALAKQWSSTGEEYRYEYDSLGRLIRSSEYNNNAFTQRTEHIYDESDRLTLQTWYNGSGATSQTYAYSDTSGLLTEIGTYYPGNIYNATPGVSNTPSVSIAYNYNGLNMLSGKTVSAGGSTVYSTNYSYNTFQSQSGETYTTNQVSAKTYGDLLLGFNRQYTYDDRGNIASESFGLNVYRYEYDEQNQLTKVKNGSDTELYSYTYDTAGNIRSKKVGEGEPIEYTYGDAQWRDLLTSYDGQTITYDNAGNPTHYYNGSYYNFEWTQGRRLATAATGGTSISYTYDMAGVRSSKTVGSTTYKYDTLSGKVMRQSWGSNVIDFIYDENNQPFAMLYNGTTYYYVLNVQGDVIGLLNANGAIAAKYTYDPWGKVTVQSSNGTANTSSAFIGNINPLRYRGYYYDTDTGLYYLQSRYYDPAIGRFINADTYTTTDADGILSSNMFAYCENNPVMGVDPTGEFLDTVLDVISLGTSIAEVAANPANPWAWVGLVGDIIDVAIPGVSGVGEATRGIKAARDIVKQSGNLSDAFKSLYKSNIIDKARQATGSYEIIFKSGKNYVGKGGMKRAAQSAARISKKYGDEATSIFWVGAKDAKSAFANEYLKMKTRGVNNPNTYNLIWSPGRNLLNN